MIAQKYIAPIKILGTAAVAVLLFGLIFDPLSEALLSEDTRSSVLVSSIPFVAVFVTIILLFVLLIFIIALRFNGLIPYRTYRPVELLIIFGIVSGVFFLFQPWQANSFRYGFICLLVSTLSFILWSHVVPRTVRAEEEVTAYATRYWIAAAVVIILGGILGGIDYGAYLILTSVLVFIIWNYARPQGNRDGLSDFKTGHYIVGGILGVVVLAALAGVILNAAAPREPYGYTEREWTRRLRDEQKAQIIADAEEVYQDFMIPFGIFISLIPASAVFFIAREAAAALTTSPETESAASPAMSAASHSGG